jgi:hypothetical protein
MIEGEPEVNMEPKQDQAGGREGGTRTPQVLQALERSQQSLQRLVKQLGDVGPANEKLGQAVQRAKRQLRENRKLLGKDGPGKGRKAAPASRRRSGQKS